MKIIGICGSLRKGSYNMALLKYVKDGFSDEIDYEILDISKLPIFNQDLEDNLPIEVKEYIYKLMTADAFIIATPEYNYSLPPLLKNALDWGSRGDRKGFENKYVSIMSASPGMFGGARVQYHLRQILVSLNAIPLNRPEVFVGNANEKIDENGNLIDEYTKSKVKEAIDSLINKIKD